MGGGLALSHRSGPGQVHRHGRLSLPPPGMGPPGADWAAHLADICCDAQRRVANECRLQHLCRLVPALTVRLAPRARAVRSVLGLPSAPRRRLGRRIGQLRDQHPEEVAAGNYRMHPALGPRSESPAPDGGGRARRAGYRSALLDQHVIGGQVAADWLGRALRPRRSIAVVDRSAKSSADAAELADPAGKEGFHQLALAEDPGEAAVVLDRRQRRQPDRRSPARRPKPIRSSACNGSTSRRHSLTLESCTEANLDDVSQGDVDGGEQQGDDRHRDSDPHEGEEADRHPGPFGEPRRGDVGGRRDQGRVAGIAGAERERPPIGIVAGVRPAARRPRGSSPW